MSAEIDLRGQQGPLEERTERPGVRGLQKDDLQVEQKA